jgi:dTDP-4-dehydrorhamnose reductase
MIKILITGSNGFLGSNLVRFFSNRPEYKVFSTSQRPSVNYGLNDFIQGDLLDTSFIDRLISSLLPDLVINTVSLVNVDQCEENPDLAFRLAVNTAENIARASERNGCRLIYISTDHLFDGKKAMYTEDDISAPVNVYGRTKLDAEIKTRAIAPNAVIVRTNFFGWSPVGHAPTFGEWVYNNLKEQKPMNLFTDYYFTPIEVTYLAEAIETVSLSKFSGIIDIAGSERCSKYEFGMELADVFDLDPSPIRECSVHSATFRAKRQQDLSLSTEKFRQTFRYELPDLETSLTRFKKTRPVMDKYT